jgi:hypothetical protein
MILAYSHRDHDNETIRIRHVEGGFRTITLLVSSRRIASCKAPPPSWKL